MKSPDQAAFKVILIASMAVALIMLPFVARAACCHGGPPAFSEFDKDADGLVSESEFNETRAARHAKMAEEGRPMRGLETAPSFADLDSDGDGMLNEAELAAGQRAHMKSMHGGEKGHGKHAGMHHGKGMKMPTFQDLDLNGDDCIDADEFARHQAERHGKAD